MKKPLSFQDIAKLTATAAGLSVLSSCTPEPTTPASILNKRLNKLESKIDDSMIAMCYAVAMKYPENKQTFVCPHCAAKTVYSHIDSNQYYAIEWYKEEGASTIKELNRLGQPYHIKFAVDASTLCKNCTKKSNKGYGITLEVTYTDNDKQEPIRTLFNDKDISPALKDLIIFLKYPNTKRDQEYFTGDGDNQSTKKITKVDDVDDILNTGSLSTIREILGLKK